MYPAFSAVVQGLENKCVENRVSDCCDSSCVIPCFEVNIFDEYININFWFVIFTMSAKEKQAYANVHTRGNVICHR